MPEMLRVHGGRQTRAIGSIAAFIGWLLVFAAVGPSRAGDSTPNSEPASVERALAMLKEGADGREVAAMLEPLGYDGDARAQLLIGALYVEGKSMPRDVVEGYAWLQVAATAADPAIASQATKMLLAGETALSGADLIRADQRANTIRSTMAERTYERYGAGVRQFTPERPVSFSPWIKFEMATVQLTATTESQVNPDFRLGCAVSAARRCPSNSRAIPEPRCTGRIAQADTGPSSVPSDQAHIVPVELPPRLRGRDFRATAYVVAHVDRSGWVCGAAIAKSSGEPLWDAAVLDGLTRWRLNPAMRHGEAVESLHMMAVSANSY